MIEIWKDIPNYDGKYQISNYGRVKSLNYKRSGKEQTLKPFITGHGYLQVPLCKNGARKLIYIHKVMANVFLDRKSFKSMAYEDRKKIIDFILEILTNLELTKKLYKIKENYNLKGDIEIL